jgi:hypothetical protein
MIAAVLLGLGRGLLEFDLDAPGLEGDHAASVPVPATH